MRAFVPIGSSLWRTEPSWAHFADWQGVFLELTEKAKEELHGMKDLYREPPQDPSTSQGRIHFCHSEKSGPRVIKANLSSSATKSSVFLLSYYEYGTLETFRSNPPVIYFYKPESIADYQKVLNHLKKFRADFDDFRLELNRNPRQIELRIDGNTQWDQPIAGNRKLQMELRHEPAPYTPLIPTATGMVKGRNAYIIVLAIDITNETKDSIW